MPDESMRTEQFPVRMSVKDKALLRKLAERDDRSMNDIVLLAVRDYAQAHDVTVRRVRGGWA